MHGPSYIKEVYKTTPEIRTSPFNQYLKLSLKSVQNRGIPLYSIIIIIIYGCQASVNVAS